VILPSEDREVAEAVNHTAADYLRQDLAHIITARRLGSYVIGQTLYVQKLTSLFQKEKAQLLLGAAQKAATSSALVPSSYNGVPSPEELTHATQEYTQKFKELKKIGAEIIQNIKGKIHPTAYMVHHCLFISAAAEAYAEMGNFVRNIP